MNLLIKGVTNKPYSMVSGLIFTFPDGKEIGVESDSQRFYAEEIEETGNYNFELTFEVCYIFNPYDHDAEINKYLTFSDLHKFDDAEITEFAVFEDTVPDYYIEMHNFKPFL